MPTRAIDQELRGLGTWFLPGESRVVPGAFTWKDRRGTLELHDSLAPIVSGSERAKRHPVVLGNLYTGEPVTLLDALDASPVWHFVLPEQPRPQKLSSLHAVVGAHLDERSRVTQFSARVPGLQHWLSRKWFTNHVAPVDDGRPHVTIVAKYPEVTTVRIPGANVHLSLDVLPEHKGQGGFVMSTMGRLTITPDEPQSFDWLLERFSKVAALLTIMAGSPISTDQILIAQEGAGLDASVLLSLRNPETCSIASDHEFFLTERTLGISVGDAMIRWFEHVSSVDLPSRLAVDVLNDQGSTYMDFLGVMQALEGFHRGAHGGQYMVKEAFDPIAATICTAIPSTISDGHKKALKSRVGWGFQYSLPKRMDELVSALPADLQRRIIGVDAGAVSVWVKARNAYTHWDPSVMADAIDGMELIGAIRRLKMLLRVSYLRLVRVPDPSIIEAMDGMSEVSRQVRFLPQPRPSRQSKAKGNSRPARASARRPRVDLAGRVLSILSGKYATRRMGAASLPPLIGERSPTPHDAGKVLDALGAKPAANSSGPVKPATS